MPLILLLQMAVPSLLAPALTKPSGYQERVLGAQGAVKGGFLGSWYLSGALCCLSIYFCRFDTSSGYLGTGNLNGENVSIRLACRHMCQGIFSIND